MGIISSPSSKMVQAETFRLTGGGRSSITYNGSQGNKEACKPPQDRIVFFNEEEQKMNGACLANGKDGVACRHIYAVVFGLNKRHLFNDEKQLSCSFIAVVT